MKNRSAVFGLIALFPCIAIFYATHSATAINTTIINTKAIDEDKANSPPAETQLPASPSSTSINTANPSTTDKNAESQMDSAPLWQPVDINTVAFDARFSDYNRIAIARINPAAFKQLKAGSEIELELPQDAKKYVISFEVEEQLDSDNRSISGHLKDYGQDFPVTFTLGATAIYGSVSTPREAFSIRGEGDIVRIIPVSELEKHIDYSKTDAAEWGTDKE